EVFKNGMNAAGLNTYGQQAVTGLMILAAIVMDYFRKKREETA
ncbi:MAG TPA: ABC transporter permease, partial [Lachnoclostridium sp.]|nr:ABC transporter permease [Lachnoclostridium sp.]